MLRLDASLATIRLGRDLLTTVCVVGDLPPSRRSSCPKTMGAYTGHLSWNITALKEIELCDCRRKSPASRDPTYVASGTLMRTAQHSGEKYCLSRKARVDRC